VQPGDVLELHVTTIRGRGKIWKFRGEAKVGDTLCAEAEFAAMILSKEEASAKG
jgi:3-hydroxyacyl-[acyl-carrier-protein] dehydratase